MGLVYFLMQYTTTHREVKNDNPMKRKKNYDGMEMKNHHFSSIEHNSGGIFKDNIIIQYNNISQDYYNRVVQMFIDGIVVKRSSIIHHHKEDDDDGLYYRTLLSLVFIQ
uniref:Uncharacterized protein n=1 Tax=Cacopsylla melanoneura TaxID=428564 RepID=A0A8D8ZEM2_9HEMI